MIKPCKLDGLNVFKDLDIQIDHVNDRRKKFHRFNNLSRYEIDNSSNSIKVDLLLQHADKGYINRPSLLRSLYQCRPDQKLRISRLMRLIDLSVNRYFKDMNRQIEQELNYELESPISLTLDFFENYNSIEGVSFSTGYELDISKFNMSNLSNPCKKHLFTVMNKLSTYGVFDLFSDQLNYFCNFYYDVFEPENGMYLNETKMEDALNYLKDKNENNQESDFDKWFSIFEKSIYFKGDIYTKSGKDKLINKYRNLLKSEIESCFGEEWYHPFFEFYNMKISMKCLLTTAIVVDDKALNYNCHWNEIFNHLPRSRNKFDKKYISIIMRFRSSFELIEHSGLENDENGTSFINSVCLYSSSSNKNNLALSRSISSCEDDFMQNQECPLSVSDDPKITNDYIKTFSVINAFIGSLKSLEPKKRASVFINNNPKQ